MSDEPTRLPPCPRCRSTSLTRQWEGDPERIHCYVCDAEIVDRPDLLAKIDAANKAFVERVRQRAAQGSSS